MQCTVCKRLLVSAESLEKHMRRHEKNGETADGNYAKFMAENFDMKCDNCDAVFEGLYDARMHYKEIHERKGYVKCCNTKLREVHIENHFDPTRFRYCPFISSYTKKSKFLRILSSDVMCAIRIIQAKNYFFYIRGVIMQMKAYHSYVIIVENQFEAKR